MARQTEWNFQKDAAEYLDIALPSDAYWSGIDHAGKMTPAAGRMRKLRGVKAGIADVMIVWRGITLWIELKAGSALSASQKDFRDAVIRNGHAWALARSLDDIEFACALNRIPMRGKL